MWSQGPKPAWTAPGSGPEHFLIIFKVNEMDLNEMHAPRFYSHIRAQEATLRPDVLTFTRAQ